MINFGVSIVLYKNNYKQIEKTTYSVLGSNINIKLWLIDNPLTDELKSLKD